MPTFNPTLSQEAVNISKDTKEPKQRLSEQFYLDITLSN